jgi:ribosomal protein L11 methyltransferase
LDTDNWLEISIRLDGEAAEAVSEVFNRYGTGGAVIEQLLAHGLGAHDNISELVIKTYVARDDTVNRQKIKEALWHLGQLYPIPTPGFRVLTEADWAEAWKTHYSVLHIGQHTVIVPQWQSYDAQPDQVTIRLDPGMAFGTGTHPTTRLCLAALEQVIEPGMTVFDIGTGSGVLSIAAAKQGSGQILAVDVDEIAINVAKRNIETNEVANIIRVETGSIERANGRYDLVLVNILAQVILSLLGQGLTDTVRPGGTVIASGIIDDQEAEVQAAFVSNGLEVVERLVEKDWIALIGRKAEQ